MDRLKATERQLTFIINQMRLLQQSKTGALLIKAGSQTKAKDRETEKKVWKEDMNRQANRITFQLHLRCENCPLGYWEEPFRSTVSDLDNSSGLFQPLGPSH